MSAALPPLRWADRSPSDRAARILLWLGIAAFAASWAITLWLDMTASGQPTAATGPFQVAYHHNGQVNYITALQDTLAHLRHGLTYGWEIALIAGVWLAITARRAQRTRIANFMKQNAPPA